MNAVALLVGLLVVAYGGSMLLGGRALRGYGLPSGSEWLVLGFVLGPEVLGVTSSEALATFKPLLGLATAWLAFVLGAEYGYAGERRASVRSFVIGLVCAVTCAAIMAGLVFWVATRFAHWPARDSLYMAVGFGLAACETARYAVRWVVERDHVDSPLRRLLEDLADTDEAVPLLGLGVLFALTPGELALELAPWQWLGITAGLGILLGLLSAMLLASFEKVEGAWAVLLGASWLATGIAWRLGVSALSVLFLLGVTLCAASRHAPRLRNMLARTEPAVLLPTLLLAGGLVHVPRDFSVWLVVGAALIARAVARTLVGGVLARLVGAPPGTRLSFAVGLWSTGALTPIVALTCAIRFPGAATDALFTAACAATVAGELFGPLALHRAMGVGAPPAAPPVAAGEGA
jgi:hypothetical protein